MPARINYHPDADRLQDRFELWRTVRFGDLVDLVMTDERLFRDPPKDVPGGVPTREATAPKYEPEDRSMLGADQRSGSWRRWRTATPPGRSGPTRCSRCR